MTEPLFRDDPYATGCTACVTAVSEAGFEVDRTVFYAMSGGQEGDTGQAATADGRMLSIVGAVHPERDRNRILHLVPAGTALPAVGDMLALRLDWDRRHRLMRLHTGLHLLSVVLPFGVTGGAIAPDKGRLDFDMPEPPADPGAIEDRLNALVADDLGVTEEWITEAELAASPGLVKTMAVQPPSGQGRVRLIRIGAGGGTVDLQPCGGTHVRTTAEIGRLAIGRIEKKGRSNRRVNLHLAE
jgi:misacylated tRNA(Ala) deacylase